MLNTATSVYLVMQTAKLVLSNLTDVHLATKGSDYSVLDVQVCLQLSINTS